MTSKIKQFLSIRPVLHAQDYKATLKYYRDVLGFSIAFDFAEYTYACVERDGIELHITGTCTELDHARAAIEARKTNDIYIYVTNVDAYYEEVKERGANCYSEPDDWPYGMRDFMVRDPNGYILTFGQRIETAESS